MLRSIRFLVLISAAAAVAAAQDANRALLAVGEFSDMRYTQEHAYGHTVQLWRDGDSLIGFLLVSEGLQGDTPIGLLENVRFDPRTGALSFVAKLSIGVNLFPDGRQEPSRDLFEFSGNLDAMTLTGTLKWADQARSAAQSSERVQLAKLPAALPAGSFSGWKRQADILLQIRGPRW
jgi:hypothetical protein